MNGVSVDVSKENHDIATHRIKKKKNWKFIFSMQFFGGFIEHNRVLLKSKWITEKLFMKK